MFFLDSLRAGILLISLSVHIHRPGYQYVCEVQSMSKMLICRLSQL